MVQPTIASRLERKFVLVSSDIVLAQTLEAALPERWQITRTTDPVLLGGFADLLQHRFMLLDLGDAQLDVLEVIDTVRRELMLNIAILCLGGDAAQRDAARLARADRFYERDEAVTVMRQFCEQYDW